MDGERWSSKAPERAAWAGQRRQRWAMPTVNHMSSAAPASPAGESDGTLWRVQPTPSAALPKGHQRLPVCQTCRMVSHALITRARIDCGQRRPGPRTRAPKEERWNVPRTI